MKLAQGKITAPARICILNLKIEEGKEQKKEEEEAPVRKSMVSSKAGEKEKEKKERVNNKLIYSFYIVDMLGDDDYEKTGQLYWRHEVATTMTPNDDSAPQAKMTIAPKDILKGKLIGGDEPAFEMDEFEDEDKKDRDADRKPDVLYANDYELTEMVMVILADEGSGGQHHVY